MSSWYRKQWRAITSPGSGRKERPPPNKKRGPGAGDRAFLKSTNCNSNTQLLNPSGRAAQAKIVADLRFWHDVQAMYRLGRRAVYELLVELSGDFLIRATIEIRVERYGDRLSPELLRLTDGDRMPPVPVRVRSRQIAFAKAVSS
jgi:hypothetical protein